MLKGTEEFRFGKKSNMRQTDRKVKKKNQWVEESKDELDDA